MLSTRFGGLDGVSLEVKKLAAVLAEAGHEVVWFGGWLAKEYTPGHAVAAADFDSPENRALQARVFGPELPDLQADTLIAQRAVGLRYEVESFLDEFAVDVLIAHNVLSLPLQIPLAVALTDVIERRQVPVVAHHHDWWFERPGMEIISVPGLMVHNFPPRLDNVEHLVINSIAGDQLGERFGIGATLLPNVMDFEAGPPVADGRRFRKRTGIEAGEIVLLQPTRIIPRKGIENTIELAGGLRDLNARVVATHGEDVHWTYRHKLVEMAKALQVDLRFVPASSESELTDAYAAADLVCFPSRREGFGNALIEAFFHRRPVLVNRYDVYVRDIVPTGVRCIEIDDEITPNTLSQVTAALERDSASDMTDTNYRIGEEYFSYRVLRDRFLPLVESAAG